MKGTSSDAAGVRRRGGHRTRIGAAEARRIALAAQGFNDPAPNGRVDARHVRRVLSRVGLFQLDSVNVCVRAHYMPLFSRLGPYDRPLIDDIAYRRGELFEYWGHEAALMPMATYPLYRWRMEGWRPGRWFQEYLDEHPGHLEAVYDEVAERGPTSVRDLEDPGARSGPWWGHGKGKKALDWLYTTGRLAIADRHNFTRYYDIRERVISAEVLDAPTVEEHEAQRRLLMLGAHAHGIATVGDLADYPRLRMPQARPRLAELIEEGELVEVEVEGWDQPGYLAPTAPFPRSVECRALLSPFDSLVFNRDRDERLFGFHYRIEIYVPEHKRRYGYYVYPFLLGDQLVARVDLKADRATGTLQAKGAFVEPGCTASSVAGPLADELRSMAGWLELDRVGVGRKGDLAASLRAAIGR